MPITGDALASADQVRDLLALLADGEKITDPAEQTGYLAEQVRRDITSPAELTAVEAADLIEFLRSAQAADGETKA